MSAPLLMVLFDAVYLIALTAWVGSILFFSFGIAPILFQVLDAEAAGKFVRVIFPRYYLWGAISGAIALPSAVAVPLAFPELRGPWVGVRALVILASTLIMLYAGNSLTPRINESYDAGLAGRARFERLHKRSVRLNGLVLVLGLGLLIAFAARPHPRSEGTIELTPFERALLRTKLESGAIGPPAPRTEPAPR